MTEGIDEAPGQASKSEEGRGDEEGEVVAKDFDEFDAEQGTACACNFVQDVDGGAHLPELFFG